jgi:hypothetical protein
MKRSTAIATTALFLAALMPACQPDAESPVPANPKYSAVLEMAAVLLPDSPGDFDRGDLRVSIRLANAAGVPLIDELDLPLLESGGKLVSQPFNVERAGYQITRLMVLDPEGSVLYAIPEAASTKAEETGIALPLAFNIQAEGETRVTAAVLPVNEDDLPEWYGYPSDAFGMRPYYSLPVKTTIRIGSVDYDSLGLLVSVLATADGMPSWSKGQALSDGHGTVLLPRQYSHFTVWFEELGLRAEAQFNRDFLPQNQPLELKISGPAKKLKSEERWVEKSGNWELNSRTEYYFRPDGKLQRIDYHLKKLNDPGLSLLSSKTFEWSGDRLLSIEDRGEDNYLFSRMEYAYRADGRIDLIRNEDPNMGSVARFNYHPARQELTGIVYEFENGSQVNFPVRFKKGNLITAFEVEKEEQYDRYINPHHHLGYTDFFLLNASRNNITRHHVTAGSAIPTIVPDKSQYMYDGMGYPVERITTFKGFSSGAPAGRDKKVYMYY